MRRLHAFPGMGADARLFPSSWSTLPGWTPHNWAPYSALPTIPEVARAVVDRAGIEDGDAVVGASLGGMVAAEITRLRRLECLVLVGSALRPMEVHPAVRALHPLARVAPIRLLQVSALSVPGATAEMFSVADPDWVRAMSVAVFAWEGLSRPTLPVVRIHGRHDRLIPQPPSVDLSLDGGHLVAFTHAEACVRYLRSRLS